MADSLFEFCIIEASNGDNSNSDIEFIGKHYLTKDSTKFLDTTLEKDFLSSDLVGISIEKNIKVSDVESFSQYKVVVSHEVEIDFGFLTSEMKRLYLGGVVNTVIDTRKLALLIYPNLKNYELEYLLNYTGLPDQQSYLDKVAILFVHLCKIASNRNIDVFLAIARS